MLGCSKWKIVAYFRPCCWWWRFKEPLAKDESTTGDLTTSLLLLLARLPFSELPLSSLRDNLLLGRLVNWGGCLLTLWTCCMTCFSVWPEYLNLEPKEKTPVPTNEGETWTNLKKAWCSTQHFHKCLQACLEGVSKPYVLSSFCGHRQKITLHYYFVFSKYICLHFCLELVA